MFILGLTGSVGMGKSTTASLFSEFGVPVFDSDACVHMLYGVDGAAISLFARDAQLKKTITKDDKNREYIDRAKLGKLLFSNPEAKAKIEKLVHGLVQASQQQFLEQARLSKYPLVILDIPLLYETSAERRVDAVCVVTAPRNIQRQRVMARPNMTEERFQSILKFQMSDSEKRKRADFIINTALGLGHTRRQVRTLLDRLGLSVTRRLTRF